MGALGERCVVPYRGVSVCRIIHRCAAILAAMPSSAYAGANVSRVVGTRFAIPIQYLFARPRQNAFMLANVLVEFFKKADPVRHAGEIGVDTDSHYAHRLCTFAIKAIELTHATL